MSFKKEAILCDVYEMGKGSSVNVGETVGKAIFTNRIFGLDAINKINSDYFNKRRWVEIKWEETAKIQEDNNQLNEWVAYMLAEKKFECKKLKRDIKFPVKDSYLEALEYGEELIAYNDYIEVVEKQIEIIEGIKPKVKNTSFQHGGETIIVTDGMMDELKATIKSEGLGIRVGKDDTCGDVYIKIENARNK